MDVAISGDRACCLTQELAAGTYLFAVANGFGMVEGQPVAPAVLARLRTELVRRARGDKLRRAEHTGKGISSSLLAAFSRVNEDMHARTASHEDYVTAGCSVTSVLMVRERAYLAHIGSTAAYLARDGYVVSLTSDDAFEGPVPILTRALVAAPSVDVAVCTFSLSEGDALVLAGRRLRENHERRQLADTLAHTMPDASSAREQLLVVRYTPAPPAQVPVACRSHKARNVLTGVIATLVFYTMLCIR